MTTCKCQGKEGGEVIGVRLLWGQWEEETTGAAGGWFQTQRDVEVVKIAHRDEKGGREGENMEGGKRGEDGHSIV